MYEIKKTFSFEAGHVLTHHDGQCSRPHGHSYQVTLTLQSPSLTESGPKTNMLVDFKDISTLVKPMIDRYFEHRWLNETLDTDSPTAEFIAHWIYHHLKPSLPLLHSVAVAETKSSIALYFTPKS